MFEVLAVTVLKDFSSVLGEVSSGTTHTFVGGDTAGQSLQACGPPALLHALCWLLSCPALAGQGCGYQVLYLEWITSLVWQLQRLMVLIVSTSVYTLTLAWRL